LAGRAPGTTSGNVGISVALSCPASITTGGTAAAASARPDPNLVNNVTIQQISIKP